VDLLLLAGSAPMAMQNDLATAEAVDGYLATQMGRRLPVLDANDLWYQVNASWDYDPSADLERMTAPTVWINSADDFINPPELGLAERFAPRIANGTYRLIPNSIDGKGHGTHTWARFWQDDLIALLARTEPEGVSRHAWMIVILGSSICPRMKPSPSVGEVGATRMARTTSIPWTTRPNTAKPSGSMENDRPAS
jgi:hypothetical protein